MKKLLLTLTLTLSVILSFAQGSEDLKYGKGVVLFVDGEVAFSEVVQVKGKTAEELYSLAKLAIAEMFKSAKDVIQLDDKENGIIVVKGLYYAPSSTTKPYYDFMIKLLFKDGKYKIHMTNFVYNTDIESTSANMFTDERCFDKRGKEKGVGKFARRFLINTKDYILSTFKTKMTSSTKKDDNW